MKKLTVFISHISEESEIANLIKEFVEHKFLRMIDVFVSSNEQSVRLGDDWFESIKESISKCQLMIVICSPVSVARPWINFEAGAGWVRKIPVVPLCHSGITPGRLPIPLSSLQAGMINERSDLQKLFDRLAKLAEITSPSAEDKHFFASIAAFETDTRANSLLKDSTFIANILRRQVELLKYCIVASTKDYNFLENFDLSNARIEDLEFTFNDVHRLYNVVLLWVSPTQKIFRFLQVTVQRIAETIRFIFSNKHVDIAPELEEKLNEFLYALPLIDNWYDSLSMFDQGSSQKETREMLIKMVQDEPLPATRRNGNAINVFINYYDSLVIYKTWLTQYVAIIDRLT